MLEVRSQTGTVVEVNQVTAPTDRPFQILAIDGGGLKGIFASAALAALEKDFDTDLRQHFDLIAGTSTGGLIALALAAGVRPSQVRDLYVENARTLFPARWGRRPSWRRAKYSSAPLRKLLEAMLGTRTLADSPVRLAIPAFDLASNDVYLFRTPHHERLRRDHRELLVDVGLATAAAPTYFPAHRLRGLRLVDGGVWANNPTMLAVVEGLSSCGATHGSIRVLNVGTTTEVKQRPGRLDNGGLLAWRGDGLDVVLRGQGLASANHAGLLLGAPISRLDVPVPRGCHRLDSVDEMDLTGKAEATSRHFGPKAAPFFSHVAPPYPNFVKEATDGVSES